MVRKYEPKNRINPRSKLTENQTLDIFTLYLLSGDAPFVAQKTHLSEKTVNSVLKKFRTKLWGSKGFRYRSFETFYGDDPTVKEGIIAIADSPEEKPEAFWTALASCVTACPSQWQVRNENALQMIRAFDGPKLNDAVRAKMVVQLTKLKSKATITTRNLCPSCRVKDSLPFFESFYTTYADFLAARRLHAADVKEHFLMACMRYLILQATAGEMGMEVTRHDFTITLGADHTETAKTYVKTYLDFCLYIARHIYPYLVDDPL